jgi:subtilase family serine protease
MHSSAALRRRGPWPPLERVSPPRGRGVPCGGVIPGLLGALTALALANGAWARGDVPGAVLSASDAYGLELVIHTTADVSPEDGAALPRLPDETWSYPGAPGAPLLPWRRFYVGLPPEGSWWVDWDAAGKTTVAASVAHVEGDEWVEQPSLEVEVEGEGYIRDVRVASVVVRPYLVGAAGLTVSPTVTIRMGWEGGGGRAEPVRDVWDSLYRRIVVNYREARGWRSRPGRSTPRAWQPPEPAIKLYVDEAALYRLDRDWWDGVEVNPAEVNPHTVRIFRRGQELPIWVSCQDDSSDTTWDPDDCLIFYGTFNPREDQQGRARPTEGEYTAENVYWLTWGGEPGLRLPESDVTPTGQPPPAQFYWSTVRAERDSVAPYGGRSGIDLTEIHWFWRWFLAGGPYHSEVFPLSVDNLVSGQPATIRVKMRGYSQTSPWGPHHHTALLLNGRVVSDSAWGDPSGRDWFFLEAPVPASWVSEGVNELEVRLYPDAQAGYTSAICFDWWELDFARRYVAIDDSISFTGPAAPQGGYRFSVEAFESDSVEVMDVVAPARLVGHRTAGGVLSFDMTASAAETLVALGVDRLGYPARWVWDVAPEDPLASPEGQAANVIVSYDPSTGGDQLPNLYNAAVALYQFRSTTLQSRLVDVQDIYDEFSYGVFHPPAIRDFLDHAFHSWNETPLRSVLLLGDANYDYRGFISTGVNFIPSIGNPPNDNLFACLTKDSAGTYDDLPDIWIGRLPASTETGAYNLVEKVISYCQDPPPCTAGEDPWKKNVLFVAGASDTDYVNPIHRKIDSFVLPPPAVGYADSVFRAGAGDYEPLYYNWQIREALNEGRIMLDYFGHAGGTTMGVMFDSVDADSLRNAARLPFAVAITCYLGHFAEPDSALLGERLLRSDSPENGAIGVWTSTGLSGNSPPANDAVFRSLFADFLSGQPEAGTLGYATMESKLVGFRNQYVLLGDPEARIALPVEPDLAVFAEEVEVTPESLGVNQEAFIRARLRNLGSAAANESCQVRVSHESPGGATASVWQGSSHLPRLAEAFLVVPWTTPDEIGIHRIMVHVDPLGEVVEEREDNNIAVLDVPVLHQAPHLCQPMRYALLSDDRPLLAVHNVAPRQGCTFQYLFEVSPSDAFDPAAPGHQSSGFMTEGSGGVTSWQPGALADSTTYFWRCRIQEQGNPGAWMGPGSFTVVRAQLQQGWHQTARLQFADDSLWNTDAEGAPGSVILSSEIGLIDYAVESEGAAVAVSSVGPGSDPRGLIGDGFFIFADGDQDQWAVVSWPEDRLLSHLGSRQMAGSMERGVWSYYRIDTSVDSMEWTPWCELGPFEFPALENIPPIMYADSLPPVPVRHARYRFGRCDLSGKGSYIKKLFAKTRTFSDSGSIVSSSVGPAWQWGSLSWDQVLPLPVTFLTIDLLGRSPGSQAWEDIPGWQGLQTGMSLAGLDPEAYPRLRLRANLATEDSIYSSSLSSWTVTFDPARDLALGPGDVSVEPPAVPPGDTLHVVGGVRNAGLVSVEQVGVALFSQDGESLAVVGDTVWIDVLPPGDAATMASFPWVASAGVNDFLLWVDPADMVSEVDEENNTAAVQIGILADLSPDSILLIPDPPMQGDTATLRCWVGNAGVLPCSSWALGLTVASTGWSGEAAGCVLEPAESCSLDIVWPTPPAAGVCTLQVVCDPRNEIEEADEENNTALLVTRVVTTWDFQARGLSFSNPLPPEGDPITLTAVLVNAGESPAESVEVAFWDGAPGAGILAGSAWAWGVGGLDSAFVDLDWPTAANLGRHEMWVVLDPGNIWEESREDNNDTMAVVVVDTLADLLVPQGGVTLEPDSVVIGGGVEATGIVRNSSFTAAGPFAVAWWLGSSPDSLLSQLAPETPLAGLAGTSQETLRLAFEPETEGDTWVVLLLDVGGAVDETNEANNRSATELVTSPLPDLSISRSDIAFSDAQPLEGDTIEVTVWIHNVSTTPTGPFAVSVWDGDPGGQSSALIHEAAGLELGGLATEEHRVPWWLGYDPGAHDVWVLVDSGEQVAESSEANNTAWRTIQILQDTLAPRVTIVASVAGFRDGDFLALGDTLRVSVVDPETGPDTSSVLLTLNGALLPSTDWQMEIAAPCSFDVYYPVGPGNGTRLLRASAADLAGNAASSTVHYRLAEGLALGAVCCYPSPFSDATSVLVPLSRDAAVRVTIMTLSGRPVRVLEESTRAPFGTLEWDGTDEDGDQVAAGVYLYVVKADDGQEKATFLGKVVRMPG